MDGKIIVLLFGGDNSSQRRDIEKAKEILKRIKK
jgi:putative component of toxin-antitoxin plasmid stabilization module